MNFKKLFRLFQLSRSSILLIIFILGMLLTTPIASADGSFSDLFFSGYIIGGSYAHMYEYTLTVAKHGGDYTTIQEAINYAKTNWVDTGLVSYSYPAVIIVYSGDYVEQLYSYPKIHIRGIGDNSNIGTKGVRLYNIGNDPSNYPISTAEGNFVHLSNFNIYTTTDGIIGSINDGMFSNCFFNKGKFIETEWDDHVYLEFRDCDFSGTTFDLEGNEANNRYIAFSDCWFSRVTLNLNSFHNVSENVIDFKDTWFGLSNIVVGGDWSLKLVDSHTYGTERNIFNTTEGNIYIIDSVMSNGLNFTANPNELVMYGNSFRDFESTAPLLPDGSPDIVASVNITNVTYLGNMQYNGLSGEFQTASKEKSVGVSLFDAYMTIQYAIDATIGATKDDRYSLNIAPGFYNETLDMKEFVDIKGHGAGSKSVIIYSNEGTIISYDDPGCFQIENIKLKSENVLLLNISNGTSIFKNIKFEPTSSNVSAAIIQITGDETKIDIINSKMIITLNENNGTYEHTIINLSDDVDMTIDNTPIEFKLYDVNDSITLIGDKTNGSLEIFNSNININVLHENYSGIVKMYELLTPNGMHVFMGNHISVNGVVDSNNTGTGYGYYLNIPGGSLESTSNFIHIQDLANNYFAHDITGEILKTHFDDTDSTNCTSGLPLEFGGYADAHGNLKVSNRIIVGNIGITQFSENSILAENGFYSANGYRGTGKNWGFLLKMFDIDTKLKHHTVKTSSGIYYEQTNILCDFTFNNFEESDEELFISLNSGDYKGIASAFIRTFINASCVELKHNPSWNNNLTNLNFTMQNPPAMFAGTGGIYNIMVGNSPASKFKIFIKNATSPESVKIKDIVGTDDHTTFSIETDAKNHDNPIVQTIKMTSSVDVDGKTLTGLKLIGDGTNVINSKVHFIDVDVIGGSVTNEGALINLNGRLSYIIKQGSGDTINSSFYESTNVLNNVTNSSSNIELWTNNNECFYVGSDENFTTISFSFDTLANKDLQFEFFYCNSSGEWSNLSVIDSTNGGTQIGSMTFTNPSDRGVCNKMVNGTAFSDAINYAYIAIKRTESSPALSTLPVERLISISGCCPAQMFLSTYSLKTQPIDTAPFSCEANVLGAHYFDISEDASCECTSGGWLVIHDHSACT